MKDKTRIRQLKFIFVLIVGLVILVISINKLFGTNENQKDQTKEYIVSTQNVKEENKDINENDYISNSADKTKNEESSKPNKNEDFSNENPYLTLYDEKTYKNTENVAKKVATLYISQNSKKTEWQAYVKSSFFNELKKKMAFKDGISREVKEVNIVPVEPNKADEIKLEAIVTWTISNGKEVISKQTKSIFLSLAKDSKGEDWLVNRIEEQ